MSFTWYVSRTGPRVGSATRALDSISGYGCTVTVPQAQIRILLVSE